MDNLTCEPGYHVECTCVPDRAPYPTWHDLGQVPAIAASPTALGRTIAQLHPFGGRIYLGYGDWNDTKQPGCDLIAYSPQVGTYTNYGHVATDAIWSIRTIGSDLWALATDPEVGCDPDAAIVAPDGTMTQLKDAPSPYPWHLFDVAEFNGTVYLAGALRTQLAKDGVQDASWATVWHRDHRVSDGREIWPPTVLEKTSQRAYGLFVLNGALWCATSSGRAYRTTDGLTWTVAGPRLTATMVKPQVWRGRVVYGAWWPAMGNSTLFAFDGTSQQTVVTSARDHHVDGDDLWTLADGFIAKNGTAVAQAPAGAVSLAVLDGAVWVGTSDSHLWVYR